MTFLQTLLPLLLTYEESFNICERSIYIIRPLIKRQSICTYHTFVIELKTVFGLVVYFKSDDDFSFADEIDFKYFFEFIDEDFFLCCLEWLEISQQHDHEVSVTFVLPGIVLFDNTFGKNAVTLFQSEKVSEFGQELIEEEVCYKVVLNKQG